MMNDLLEDAAARASRYLAAAVARRVSPSPDDIAGLDRLGGVLPDGPSDPAEVLALLDAAGSPGTVATTGGRYFGFVIGGAVPAALAANWLAGAWDQNAALRVMSPTAARVEDIVTGWIIDLLGLPVGSCAGFVTGTTMANFSALAAARTALLGIVSCVGALISPSGYHSARTRLHGASHLLP
jgi:glutamate/tyrosine decarboxylase-like PLP-dependent enzyme